MIAANIRGSKLYWFATSFKIGTISLYLSYPSKVGASVIAY